MKKIQTQKEKYGYVIFCYNTNVNYWCTSSLFIRRFEKLIENKITYKDAFIKYPNIQKEGTAFTETNIAATKNKQHEK